MYTDGASRGNPGLAGAGIAFTTADGRPLARGYRFLGTVTNNEAEYWALIIGLEQAHQRGFQNVLWRADSELLVQQVRSEYKSAKSEPAGAAPSCHVPPRTATGLARRAYTQRAEQRGRPPGQQGDRPTSQIPDGRRPKLDRLAGRGRCQRLAPPCFTEPLIPQRPGHLSGPALGVSPVPLSLKAVLLKARVDSLDQLSDACAGAAGCKLRTRLSRVTVIVMQERDGGAEPPYRSGTSTSPRRMRTLSSEGRN
jgi:ribonuclease HI